jgi:regulator of protease activity HflC (stomatin/prohibitin superfamily)
MEIFLYPIIIVIVLFIFSGLRIINEYERGIRFTFGVYSGIMTPGLNFIVPIIQTFQRVDLRTKVVDVPEQNTMTKDNVSININAVIYYRIEKPDFAILEVEDFYYAVSQLAQITMKNAVGVVMLEDVLSKRDVISNRIRDVVDKATDPWGIKVEGVDLKHIELPPEMKRVMAKEAEAEREKRSTIIKAQGEVQAAENLAHAAKTIAKTPGGLHLRTLHSINDLSSDKSNTIVYAIPAEILRVAKKFSK